MYRDTKREKSVREVVEALKESGRYEKIVSGVKKEIENATSSATLTEKFAKACEIIQSLLTEEDAELIEGIIHKNAE
ncbi:uncharacterized protein NEMAJ01_1004 [Nematocida major]|uniref:uncharacterized protein n=1 Tax=Nematocida major TaxID=1912982 RepID=UPI0020087691|nr:uncharacterized protein NEMAJ01_1004 [Nematocida major]KAH9386108.1 hypothetical protein NEMAJ01_1004 [Nematocida major]